MITPPPPPNSPQSVATFSHLIYDDPRPSHAPITRYTLWVSGRECFLKANDAGRRQLADHTSGYPGAAPPPPPPPPPVPACSLNGAKNAAGVCVCDRPWSGPECSTMNFKPVTFPQGYGMAPKLTSWGTLCKDAYCRIEQPL